MLVWVFNVLSLRKPFPHSLHLNGLSLASLCAVLMWRCKPLWVVNVLLHKLQYKAALFIIWLNVESMAAPKLFFDDGAGFNVLNSGACTCGAVGACTNWDNARFKGVASGFVKEVWVPQGRSMLAEERCITWVWYTRVWLQKNSVVVDLTSLLNANGGGFRESFNAWGDIGDGGGGNPTKLNGPGCIEEEGMWGSIIAGKAAGDCRGRPGTMPPPALGGDKASTPGEGSKWPGVGDNILPWGCCEHCGLCVGAAGRATFWLGASGGESKSLGARSPIATLQAGPSCRLGAHSWKYTKTPNQNYSSWRHWTKDVPKKNKLLTKLVTSGIFWMRIFQRSTQYFNFFSKTSWSVSYDWYILNVLLPSSFVILLDVSVNLILVVKLPITQSALIGLYSSVLWWDVALKMIIVVESFSAIRAVLIEMSSVHFLVFMQRRFCHETFGTHWALVRFGSWVLVLGVNVIVQPTRCWKGSVAFLTIVIHSCTDEIAVHDHTWFSHRLASPVFCCVIQHSNLQTTRT